MVYVPAAIPLQLKLYGAETSSPSLVVPLKNSILVILPSASEASAVRLIVACHGNVLPDVGEVKDTTGARLAMLVDTVISIL